MVTFGTRAHRLHADHVTHNGDYYRFVLPLAHGGKFDLGVHRAAHFLDCLIERHAVRLLIVELGDDVVGHDAGLGCRGIVDRRDHLHQTVLHGRLDTEATKLPTAFHLYLAEAIWIHVARMWIEPGEHAVDRRFDKLAVIG